MSNNFKASAQKRYYLHRKVRKQGYILQTAARTIVVNQFYNIGDFTPDVLELSNIYGYNIQFQIA